MLSIYHHLNRLQALSHCITFGKFFIKKAGFCTKNTNYKKGSFYVHSLMSKGAAIQLRKFAKVTLFFILFAIVSAATIYAEEAPQSKLEEVASPLVGTKYKYGGRTTAGFDCSGFTSYVFDQLGIELTRSSKTQAKMGQAVKKEDLRAGDLVFFKTNGYSISHVGIYLGNDQMIHASTNNGVEIRNMNEKYYKNTYVTARRVLTEEQYQEFAAAPEPEKKNKSQQTTVNVTTEQVKEAYLRSLNIIP